MPMSLTYCAQWSSLITEFIYSRKNLENNKDLPRPCASFGRANVLLVKVYASILLVCLVCNGMLVLKGMLGNSRGYKVISFLPSALQHLSLC